MSAQYEYPDSWSPRRKAALAVFLWPLLITAAGVAWYFSFIDELPEQIATHWGTGGTPDGFTSRETAVWFVLIGLATAWALGALILAIAGKVGTHRRLTVGFAAGIAAFMTLVMVGTAWVQRGLTDPRDATGVDGPLVVALLASIVIGIAAAFTVPGDVPGAARARGKVPASAPRSSLPAGAQTVWTRTAAPARAFWVVIAAVVLMLVVTAVLSGMWLFSLVLLALVVGLLLALSVFRVRISADGLVITTPVGFPTWRLPLHEVAEARAITVSPFAEFGGWGYRVGAGDRTGFVTRAGEAIEVERGDGTKWVVTVDDAAEGAGLLNTLADRDR